MSQDQLQALMERGEDEGCINLSAFSELVQTLELDEQVGREDRALVEAVQRGVRSGLLEHGRLMPESEQLVAAFQRRLHDALAG